MRMYFCTMENTPVGALRLVGDERGLNTVWFLRGRKRETPQEDWKEDPAFFMEVIRQLQEYFAGTLHEFEIPLFMDGTDFQKCVWKNLQKIPYGETITYGELAKRIGDSKAVRAVGAANGQNPLPIIVPCHRVIGSDGSLTGFGGGLENKRRLLDLESRQRRLL
jgi:methylated-DNA-[protein]-cysteine S-methyltransferase